MVDEYWKKKIGQLPTHVTEFCDGASSQFKCKDSWSQVADSVKTLGFPVTRHFFESSHGKGPHDGAGANVKNVVAKRNLQRVPSDEWYNKVTNAYQFFKCAQSGECLTLCTLSQWQSSRTCELPAPLTSRAAKCVDELVDKALTNAFAFYTPTEVHRSHTITRKILTISLVGIDRAGGAIHRAHDAAKKVSTTAVSRVLCINKTFLHTGAML